MQLRDSYDLGAEAACDPLVQVIDDFVTETERHHIIRLVAGRLDTALVSTVADATTSDGRTGRVAWVKHDETAIVHSLVDRVSDLVAIPIGHAESLQVVHYGATEQYKPHFDAYDMNTEKGRQRTEQGGQRIVTALMYLNAVEDGGSTIFPKLDLEVEAKPGRMVIFHNLASDTLADFTRHPKSLHGGSPVVAGQKWACNLWFRARPYRHSSAGSGPSAEGVDAGQFD
ncbi:prolyl hydroxylase family protein [Ilumatobacter sp.]|jgi:prolyl 4-hydroxylase|uniref:prolyl hydroxylase family protein n=1 Tax=Ilumatobacter sp. TaxID=1967498 RepID=UPI0030B0859B|tara:strand:- start:1366 stop:2049 length:684 start_codon:yes stop_codon:yes gene_type:complete